MALGHRHGSGGGRGAGGGPVQAHSYAPVVPLRHMVDHGFGVVGDGTLCAIRRFVGVRRLGGLRDDEFLLPWRSISAEPVGGLGVQATG
jgi:hypothetical protein